MSGCDRLVISDRNGLAWVTADDVRLIAKWSAAPRRFGRLADTARLAAWLDASGIPVAAPVPATDGRLQVEVASHAKGRLRSLVPSSRPRFSLGVLPVVDGQLLDVDDPSQVADAGRMLAAVHDALAAYPGSVDGGRPGPGEQLVHNDFRSANVLHDSTRITAVLDLEEVTCATRVADLAKAAVLLATRYRDWAPTPPDVRAAFVAAYGEHAPLTRSQHRDLGDGIAAVLRSMGWT